MTCKNRDLSYISWGSLYCNTNIILLITAKSFCQWSHQINFMLFNANDGGQCNKNKNQDHSKKHQCQLEFRARCYLFTFWWWGILVNPTEAWYYQVDKDQKGYILELRYEPTIHVRPFCSLLSACISASIRRGLNLSPSLWELDNWSKMNWTEYWCLGSRRTHQNFHRCNIEKFSEN